MPGLPGTGITRRASCGASPASTRGCRLRLPAFAPYQSSCPLPERTLLVGAGLARHGHHQASLMEGEPRIYARMSVAPPGFRAMPILVPVSGTDAPRRCRACPARALPSEPHAGRALHLRAGVGCAFRLSRHADPCAPFPERTLLVGAGLARHGRYQASLMRGKPRLYAAVSVCICRLSRRYQSPRPASGTNTVQCSIGRW